MLNVGSGEQFDESPPIFEEMKGKIAQHKIRAWGFLPDKQSYYDLLSECDVVVSTTLHEVSSHLFLSLFLSPSHSDEVETQFFGVSVIEAMRFGWSVSSSFSFSSDRLIV